MAQRAVIETKEAPMFDANVAARVAEHVASFMVQPFSVADALALIEKQCGRYTRGAHKGHLRGWAAVSRVVEGGWKKDGPGEGNGHVEYPGRVTGVVIADRFSGKQYLAVGGSR